MEGVEEDTILYSRVKSSLGPILEKVSARTAELRVFEEAISGKKLELEEVGRQVEEATTKLTELGTKSGLVPGTPPALLAVLAGSLIFNLAAGSHLASTVLAQQVGTVPAPGGSPGQGEALRGRETHRQRTEHTDTGVHRGTQVVTVRNMVWHAQLRELARKKSTFVKGGIC